MSERFWLEETDPSELDRRAAVLMRDGLWAMAAEFRARAEALRALQATTDTGGE